MHIVVWLLSLVVPADSGLPDAVRASTTVVVARRGNTAPRTIDVPIKRRAPFRRAQSPVVVTAVLKGDAKLVGQSIWIDEFDWRFSQMMSEQIAAGNRNLPSKEVPRYRALAKKPPGPKDSRILFLRVESDGAYEPVMMDAIESVEHLDAVKAACAATP